MVSLLASFQTFLFDFSRERDDLIMRITLSFTDSLKYVPLLTYDLPVSVLSLTTPFPSSFPLFGSCLHTWNFIVYNPSFFSLIFLFSCIIPLICLCSQSLLWAQNSCLPELYFHMNICPWILHRLFTCNLHFGQNQNHHLFSTNQLLLSLKIKSNHSTKNHELFLILHFPPIWLATESSWFLPFINLSNQFPFLPLLWHCCGLHSLLRDSWLMFLLPLMLFS